MNRHYFFIAFLVGTLSLVTVGGASAEQKILNHPASDVGDFDPLGETWVPSTERNVRELKGQPLSEFVKTDAPAQWSVQQQAAYLSLLKLPNDDIFVKHMKHGMAAKLFKRALQKQINNDLISAIDDYLAAIKIDDTDPAVHWYLGTTYLAAGKADEAKQEFAREHAMMTERDMTKEPPSYFLDFLFGPTIEKH